MPSGGPWHGGMFDEKDHDAPSQPLNLPQPPSAPQPLTVLNPNDSNGQATPSGQDPSNSQNASNDTDESQADLTESHVSNFSSEERPSATSSFVAHAKDAQARSIYGTSVLREGREFYDDDGHVEVHTHKKKPSKFPQATQNTTQATSAGLPLPGPAHGLISAPRSSAHSTTVGLPASTSTDSDDENNMAKKESPSTISRQATVLETFPTMRNRLAA